MRKLDRFIFKSFIIPFIGILAVVIFILMMQFLWLYIDELLGKGLSIKVILEFLAWGSITLLPLCLPLATLLAAVMTIGQLAEHNELLAMKSSGISLLRIFKPLIYTSIVISIIAFFVGNNVVPYAYNEIYTLRDDFSKTKEEISIPTGIFYNGIEGYTIKIDSDNKKTKMMYGVMLYDHSKNKGNISLTIADSALMQMATNKNYLIFKLFNGTNYQETNKIEYKDTSLELQRINFKQQESVIKLENYSFEQSKKARYSDQVKSQNTNQLIDYRKRMLQERDSTQQIQIQKMNDNRFLLYYRSQIDTAVHFKPRQNMNYDGFKKWSSKNQEKQRIERAISNCDGLISLISTYQLDSYEYAYYIRRTMVEILKKIAQAILCIILFFIGAPLGSFTRRGGLGAYSIIAVLFFVLYWVVDITGTKLANDGATTPVIGIFFSSIVMGAIGGYLTYRALQDNAITSSESFKTKFRKLKYKLMSIIKKPRIVFMGTPEFAVAPLNALIEAGYDVVAVVTVEDKPSGRGLKLNESAVKQYAVAHNIPVLQPSKLKDPEFLKNLASYKADLFVVVAFRMLPEEVWTMPKLGTFNLHASLLPQYRGAAPINWAIINGERITGVTTFMIDKEIDTGGILLRQECTIEETDCVGDLYEKLMGIGSELVVETVDGLIQNALEKRVQRSFIQGMEKLKPAPKLNKDLCHIDWRDSSKNIYNLIRGLSPYPCAFTNILKDDQSLSLKIFKAEICSQSHGEPGKILSDGKSYIKICTNNGAISILDLQLSGKKRMDVKTFLLGFRDIDLYSADMGKSKEEIAKTKV